MSPAFVKRRAWLLVLITAALAGLGACATSASTTKVAVLDFKGKRAEPAEREVVRMLGDGHEVVSDRTYLRTAKRLRAKRMSERNIARVADKLDLAAVVQGTLIKRGKNKYALKLRVREGARGKTIAKKTFILKGSKRISKSVKQRIDKMLARAIEDAEVAAEESEPVARAPKSRKIARKVRRAERKKKVVAERPKAKPAKRRTASKSKPEKKQRSEEKPKRIARADNPSKREGSEARPRREAKRSRDVEPSEEEEGPPLANIKVDKSGQAVDDEVPGALRASR